MASSDNVVVPLVTTLSRFIVDHVYEHDLAAYGCAEASMNATRIRPEKMRKIMTTTAASMKKGWDTAVSLVL